MVIRGAKTSVTDGALTMTPDEARVRTAASVAPDARHGGCDWTYENFGTQEELSDAVNAECDRLMALRRACRSERSKFYEWWPPFIAANESRMRATGQPLATDLMEAGPNDRSSRLSSLP